MGTATSLLFVILLSHPPLATASTEHPYANGLAAAHGTRVDSITVTGNKRTKTFALLREMQTQPGDVLEKKAITRDIRFLTDLSPIAEVAVTADSLGPGHTALRIRVVERNAWFFRSLLPELRYNFETGLTYGLRWRNKNFRGRLEQMSANYMRNQQGDDAAAINWSSPWIGWRHISVGGQVRYYNRGRPPTVDNDLLEDVGGSAAVAFPLTQSRMRFAQIEGSVSMDKSRTGNLLGGTRKDLIVSPQLGYRFDSRDSHIRPNRGGTFFIGVGQSIPIEDDQDPFYRLSNQMRLFLGVTDRLVLALLSDVFYQFGSTPDYATVGIGGEGTLRGFPERRFVGLNRWYGTIEWRYMYLPRKVFRLPVIKEFDVGLGFVMFLDSGITWNDERDFRLDAFHGTGGVGIRFYSPIQDVLRLDFGYSPTGEALFNAGTGVRF